MTYYVIYDQCAYSVFLGRYKCNIIPSIHVLRTSRLNVLRTLRLHLLRTILLHVLRTLELRVLRILSNLQLNNGFLDAYYLMQCVLRISLLRTLSPLVLFFNAALGFT